MAAIDTMDAHQGRSVAHRVLQATGVLWFVVAVVGQLMFAAHVVLFYGGKSLDGDIAAINKRLINGFIDGDLTGNIVLLGHLVFAFVITLGGPLQFVPQIRAHAPGFHHWNGRIYLLAAVILAVGGIHMVWTRGVLGGFANHFGITLNGLLILVFAAFAVRHAIAREIDTHRRWAMRLFLAVSGVWFLRVGYMAWIIANQGAVGMTENLDGPFDTFNVFASFLLPLGVLELYFRAQDSERASPKLAMAGALLILTAVTALGVFGTGAIMWHKDFAPFFPG
jgi:hypothetical protein